MLLLDPQFWEKKVEIAGYTVAWWHVIVIAFLWLVVVTDRQQRKQKKLREPILRVLANSGREMSATEVYEQNPKDFFRIGYVIPVLHRLAREGLVIVRIVPPGHPDHPVKKYPRHDFYFHRISKKGRTLLRELDEREADGKQVHL